MTLPDYRSNRLDVRVEHTPGLIIGVADIVPGYRLLLTNLTHECHGCTPYLGEPTNNGGIVPQHDKHSQAS